MKRKKKVIFSHFGILPSCPLCVLWSTTRNEKSMSHCYCFKRRLQRLNVIYVLFVIGGRRRRSEERLSLNLHSEHCSTNTDRVRNLHRLTCQRTFFHSFLQSTRWRRNQKTFCGLLEGKNRKIPKHRILSSPFAFLAFYQLLLPSAHLTFSLDFLLLF